MYVPCFVVIININALVVSFVVTSRIITFSEQFTGDINKFCSRIPNDNPLEVYEAKK